MNKKKSLFPTVLFILLLACQDNSRENLSMMSQLPRLESQAGIEYEESKTTWQALKEANGNSYRYQAKTLSWIGLTSITEIKVENGVVVSRIIELTKVNDNGTKEIISQYIETGASLGTHEEGSLPLTIDELYDTCVKDYLVADATQNTIYFKTNMQGMVTQCGLAPENCTDDCFQGFMIDAFGWQ